MANNGSSKYISFRKYSELCRQFIVAIYNGSNIADNNLFNGRLTKFLVRYYRFSIAPETPFQFNNSYEINKRNRKRTIFMTNNSILFIKSQQLTL